MKIKLHQIDRIKNDTLDITGSKSETNRLLILQALYPEIEIDNLSNSDDSEFMKKALLSTHKVIDIHHAGTAMRFLTAYFAIQNKREVTLTGSKRMQERPIQILVDALNTVGADISYLKNVGYPPIKITGTDRLKNEVALKANVSSQYISALMLIGSSLPDGIRITLQGKMTSIPYIMMTLSLLKDIGILGELDGNVITIAPRKVVSPVKMVVESDWSSASYYYSIVALSEINSTITLYSYKKNSYQGDAVLAKIYKKFGIDTTFVDNAIILKKVSRPNKEDRVILDLSDSPDIAQTITVTCFGLGIGCYLAGLHTLKIKETDRLLALKIEIEKLGGNVTVTEDSLELGPKTSIVEDVTINTYNDHRMAMAFAPLALKTSLFIDDKDVVSKSYPDFWDDLNKIGFKITSN